MAVTALGGSSGRPRRRVWPAASVRRLAERWFEVNVRSGSAENDQRCAWCHRSLDDAAVRRDAGRFCSAECAEAIHIAGLYLG